jgi:hypothetical protein
MFKETLGRGFVQVLAMVEIIVYLLFGKLLRTTSIMDGDVCKAA